jgi:hypothetical protein
MRNPLRVSPGSIGNTLADSLTVPSFNRLIPLLSKDFGCTVLYTQRLEKRASIWQSVFGEFVDQLVDILADGHMLPDILTASRLVLRVTGQPHTRLREGKLGRSGGTLVDVVQPIQHRV